jgi:hypothetical protein
MGAGGITDETIILNPVEFTPELPEWDLNALGLSVGLEGLDFGESSVEVERVRQDISEGVTDARWPPVACTVPILSRPTKDLPVADPLHRIENWVADVQRRRQGWVKRHFDTDMGVSGDVACFVDSAGLTPPQSWLLAHYGIELDQVLKFTRYPIWFATVEVTEDAEGHPLEAKGSGVRDLQLELADLLGTAPGLITVRLKNEGTEDWRGCYVSLECDDFSSAATAKPKYEAAQLTPKGTAAISAVVAPEVRVTGPTAISVNAVSPPIPAVVAPGDLLLMVAESGGATTNAEANTALTAAGWTTVLSEKKGNTRLTVLSRVATGGDATTTNDTGDHQTACIIAIKAGTFDPNTPFNVTAKGTQAATKAVSIPGATTTRDNCLIVACASGNLPDESSSTQFSGVTNAGLTGLTERIDNTSPEGDGGAVFAATGVLAAKGVYAATTVTAVTEAERAVISVAVNPFPEVIKCPQPTFGWQTVLGSEIVGVGHMTHVGPRRMVLRLEDRNNSTGEIQWKLEWRTLGAATWNQTMVTSTPLIVSSPVIGNYQLLDLGEARPEVPVTGDPRFQWRLQMRSLSSAGNRPLIRDVYVMSTEQWARVADTSENPIDGEPSALGGTVENSAAIGTVAWKAHSGSGEMGFSAEAKYPTVNLTSGSSNYAKVTNLGFASLVPEGATIHGIIADATPFEVGTAVADNAVRLVVGGAIQATERKGTLTWGSLIGTTPKTWGGAQDLWGQPSITWAQLTAAGFGVALSFTGAGSLALKSVNLIAAYSEGGNENRICFASRSIEFTDTGIRRQHATEEVWGDVPAPEGVLLKAPAPGQAGQDARLLVVPSVGDFAGRPDSASAKVAAKVGYRPGYLFAREAA